MVKRTMLVSAAFAVTALSPAFGQDAGDKDVTIVLSEELDLVEPCMATRSNIGRVIMQNVSETMTELDVRGDEGLMPRLATSWEDVGGGTWRFNLREGVTFSDGSSFGAEDVRHSIERAFSDELSCETPRYFSDVVPEVEVVDDHTIDITASPEQPILPLLMSLVTIVPEETPIEFTRDPVGTGPYVLSEWNQGQNLVLERRDDYWGDMPAVETATYVPRSEASVRAAMVETGEADIAPSISAENANDPALDHSYPNSETLYVRIDHAIEPFDDVRVRRALDLAIDREAFIGTLLPEGTELATAMVPPTTLGWNEDVEVADYDPERARELLEEARADGVDVDAEITLLGRTSQYPNVTEVMEALQQMWADIGLNIDLQMYEVAQFEEFNNNPFPEDRGPQLLANLHDNARGDPVFSMYFKYHSEGIQSAVDDEKVDELIEAATAASGEERVELWSELFAYLHDDLVGDILLFHMVGHARVAEDIDWTPTIATNFQLQLSEIGFKQ